MPGRCDGHRGQARWRVGATRCAHRGESQVRDRAGEEIDIRGDVGLDVETAGELCQVRGWCVDVGVAVAASGSLAGSSGRASKSVVLRQSLSELSGQLGPSRSDSALSPGRIRVDPLQAPQQRRVGWGALYRAH